MKVLLSIKPEYADRIFNGTKKYEYRKTIFKRQDIDSVVVYSSSPVQKVIGEFSFESIIQNTPADLWQSTKDYAGISEERFSEYFGTKSHGYAIKIASCFLYDSPKELKEVCDFSPPQSFAYID